VISQVTTGVQNVTQKKKCTVCKKVTIAQHNMNFNFQWPLFLSTSESWQSWQNMRTHTRVRLFKCEECGKKCYWLYKLHKFYSNVSFAVHFFCHFSVIHSILYSQDTQRKCSHQLSNTGSYWVSYNLKIKKNWTYNSFMLLLIRFKKTKQTISHLPHEETFSKV